MKYIKLYESFETDIEDILLEITDIGYNVSVTHGVVSHIQIKKDVDLHNINYEEIKDCVLRIKDYLNNSGIQISKIEKFRCNIYYGPRYARAWEDFNLTEDNYPPNDLVSIIIYYKK